MKRVAIGASVAILAFDLVDTSGFGRTTGGLLQLLEAG